MELLKERIDSSGLEGEIKVVGEVTGSGKKILEKFVLHNGKK